MKIGYLTYDEVNLDHARTLAAQRGDQLSRILLDPAANETVEVLLIDIDSIPRGWEADVLLSFEGWESVRLVIGHSQQVANRDFGIEMAKEIRLDRRLFERMSAELEDRPWTSVAWEPADEQIASSLRRCFEDELTICRAVRVALWP